MSQHIPLYVYLAVTGFFLAAYLLGSVPFGLILAKLAGLGDIRNIGSGNIGATNVLRTGNKPLALLTLFLDGGKGALAVFLAEQLFSLPEISIIAGIAAVLGHIYPVFLKFKGGKGVATALGAILVASPIVGLAMILTWLIVAFVFRFASLAAVAAFAASAPFALYLNETHMIFPCAALAALVIMRHSENISRILRGKESKIGQTSSRKY
jgi:glycerol-3-phosphate acyltransferase PlsY